MNIFKSRNVLSTSVYLSQFPGSSHPLSFPYLRGRVAKNSRTRVWVFEASAEPLALPLTLLVRGLRLGLRELAVQAHRVNRQIWTESHSRSPPQLCHCLERSWEGCAMTWPPCGGKSCSAGTTWRPWHLVRYKVLQHPETVVGIFADLTQAPSPLSPLVGPASEPCLCLWAGTISALRVWH